MANNEYTVYHIDESALGDPVSEQDCTIMQDAINAVLAERGLSNRASVVISGNMGTHHYSFVPDWDEELREAINTGFERGYEDIQRQGDEDAEIASHQLELELDAQVANNEREGQNDEPCAYCGRFVADTNEVPESWDDAAWDLLATEHAPNCEWMWTRAHTRNTR